MAMVEILMLQSDRCGTKQHPHQTDSRLPVRACPPVFADEPDGHDRSPPTSNWLTTVSMLVLWESVTRQRHDQMISGGKRC
jgi:hypothetical protein